MAFFWSQFELFTADFVAAAELLHTMSLHGLVMPWTNMMIAL